MVAPLGDESVDGFDVLNHCHDAAGEEQQERDDAQRTDDVEANEDICAGRSLEPYSRKKSSILTATGTGLRHGCCRGYGSGKECYVLGCETRRDVATRKRRRWRLACPHELGREREVRLGWRETEELFRY